LEWHQNIPQQKEAGGCRYIKDGAPGLCRHLIHLLDHLNVGKLSMMQQTPPAQLQYLSCIVASKSYLNGDMPPGQNAIHHRNKILVQFFFFSESAGAIVGSIQNKHSSPMISNTKTSCRQLDATSKCSCCLSGHPNELYVAKKYSDKS